MQRFLATLLIALVGVMALIPQALCPCAQRARAHAAEAADGQATSAPRACCVRCLARARAQVGLPTPPAHDAPRTCPCCAINGQGKYLLTLGEVVRLQAPVLVAVLPVLLLAPSAPSAVEASAPLRASPAAPDDPPPDVLRAGVVLLI